MKTLRGLKAKEYIEKVEYGLVHKDSLEQLFILEDFVDGRGDKVPVSKYYYFLVNDLFGDAFLEGIYPCRDDVDLGINEMVTFGISDVTIKIDKQGKVTIVG